MTVEPVRDIDAARRRAERIRIKARNITEQYADLRALVDEAERCEDHLALGYPSWTAYIADLFGDEPLRLPRDARIPMSNMLAEKGMSTRAIGSMLGVHHDTVATDLRAGVGNPTPVPESAEPERIDRETGEVIAPQTPTTERAAPSGDMVPPEVEQRPTFGDDSPAPRSVVGLDGKTYTRPEPKETPKETTMTAASRLAIPQPPRYGGNRPKHAQVIGNALTTASGICAALDEISELDGSLTAEKAASYADDLSTILRSLKRIQNLIKKEV